MSFQAAEALSPVNLMLLASISGQENNLGEGTQSCFLGVRPLTPGNEPAPRI